MITTLVYTGCFDVKMFSKHELIVLNFTFPDRVATIFSMESTMMSKYKIAHITDTHQAVDVRIFHKAAKYAASAGYQVYVCGLHPTHELVDGIEIFPTYSPKNKLKKLFSSISTLRNLVLKTEADLYQIHDPGLLLLGFLLSISGKKVIYDVHEDYEQKLISRLKVPDFLRRPIARTWWFIEYFLSLPFSYIVAADSHIQQKFSRADLSVIPNVPGEEFWRDSCRTRSLDNEFRLVYLGSISRDRGLLETVAALKYVRHNHVTFHVIGGTDDEELIALFKTHPNLTWHGRISWLKLGQELINADLGTVLLQPIPAFYYCPGENIVKLWEYLSVGLPILVSNFPKLEKLCNQFEFGLAVDPTDPRKIAEAIDYMIDHPEERRRFGENGKQKVRSEFNAENKMKDLIQIYDHLLFKETSNVKME